MTPRVLPWPRNPLYRATEDGQVLGLRGQPLRGGVTDGYRFVTVWPRGQRRTEYVHVIVCETFHGLRPEGQEVAHGNGDRGDCRAANLRWATPAENTADRKDHGTYTQGQDHAPAKLADADVLAIRAASTRGESRRSLAVRFGITINNVGRIIRRETWRHL